MAIDPQAAASAAAAQSDFVKSVIVAAVGLIGVFVGGVINLSSAYFVSNQQRKYRLEDVRSEREYADAKLEADRSYVRAVLARHLEAYAKHCAEVMWENGRSDYEDNDFGMPVPEFQEWPEVSWELLGANEMMKARDIALSVRMQKANVSEGAEYAADTPEAGRTYYGNAAARLGLNAWRLARQMREEAGVDPFEFPPESTNFAEALAEHVADEEERLRKREAVVKARREARIAAGKDPDDLWDS